MPPDKVEALFQCAGNTILEANPMRNSKLTNKKISLVYQSEKLTCATSKFASARPMMNSCVLCAP